MTSDMFIVGMSWGATIGFVFYVWTSLEWDSKR